MAKNNKNNKNGKKNHQEKKEKKSRLVLPEELQKWIWGIALIVVAVIVTLAFFEKAGPAGQKIIEGLFALIGNTTFAVPIILLFGGTVFFSTKYKKFFYSVLLAVAIFIISISSGLESMHPGMQRGGWLGYIINTPLSKLFGTLVPKIIYLAIFFIGFIIFWLLLKQPPKTKEELLMEEENQTLEDAQPSFIKKIFAPRFKVKEIEPSIKTSETAPAPVKTEKGKALPTSAVLKRAEIDYKFPPLDLLEPDRGGPSAGDTRNSAAVIKKTLQNFDIPVEMSEINIGPTVTQYSLKPAEGIKLSKITTLSNDLALALAAHPIRIEAPIPGKSLVGIEVPNKIRAEVRLKNLIEHEGFQKHHSPLAIVLGRDVAGVPFYTDIAKMPHMLVAGSTGAGKTIFLNNLIMSLLYKNSPEILRFILVDPKRVEFPVYNDLPHLLSPVIFDASRTVNALRWAIGEMERRFGVLSAARKRDIAGYNAQVQEKSDLMPYIVVIVDELADLMASKGRDVEAAVVRLAQMARAVGIHLVLATQRPSVEVITGLIKANITSRVAFQVASQVDSRTVLDMAGAEKLLGAGDMLYLSSELGKPRRVQASYVSEKEVKKVVGFINTENLRYKALNGQPVVNHLAEELERSLEVPSEGYEGGFNGGDDPLYEEAKRVVIESRKASASLLQRRLRIGYARAARMIDILEEKGVVGPGEGAKPREVYLTEKVENTIKEDLAPVEPEEEASEEEAEKDNI